MPAELSPQSAGRLIRGRREELGLSQAQLAKLTGITRQTVTELEAGERNATLRMLARIAESLGCRWVVGLDVADRPERKKKLKRVRLGGRKRRYASGGAYAR